MGIQEILLQQAIKEGFEEGLELSNKRSISKMLKNGNSLSEIADFLDTSIDEVIRIIKKYNLS
jgi:DNA-directed RNA polymerase specialized sigma subunit